MNPSSPVTTPVRSVATLAALAGAAAITIAYGWEAGVRAVDAGPKAEARRLLVAAPAPALTMRDDCDALAPRLGPAHAPPSLPLRTAAATRARSVGDAGESAAGRHPHAKAPCGPDETGSPPAPPPVEGLGSGWIISADGVMRMHPYSLSDRHTITVRPAGALREFKGRVIGLDPAQGAKARTKAQDATPAPDGSRLVMSPSPPERSPCVPAAARTLRKST